MRVPLEWLQQYVHVNATAEEIATTLTMGGLEVEGIETEASEERPLVPVLDVYITPNRGDCLSMVGVAREVAALYDVPLIVPEPPKSEPGGEAAKLISITVTNAELCPRFAARVVQGVKIGPSPDWMQARLLSAGQRPINNVVDITNYVMLELGQPLHAFDLDTLAGKQLIVRTAKESETVQTLDGEERPLSSSMVIIADAERPISVAGIMGGANTEVSDTTTNVLFEAAHWNPLSIRRTSRALNLRTDASYRFERVVDPALCRRAVDRACELLAQMGQPAAVPGAVDVMPNPIQGRDVTLRVSRAAERLGMEITPEIALACLRRLTLQAELRENDVIAVHVPPFRPDLTLEEDLIEEVGRVYGYANIPETLPVGGTTRGGDSEDGRLIGQIKRALAECGLQEVVTHSLTAPSFFDAPEDALRRVPMKNALSAELSGLRRSLLPTLLDVADHNAARQQSALAIFEVGRVWQNVAERSGGISPQEYIAVGGLLVGSLTAASGHPAAKDDVADFYMARGVVERLLQRLNIAGAKFRPAQFAAKLIDHIQEGDADHIPVDPGKLAPQFHPQRVAFVTLHDNTILGVCGELHPLLAEKLRFRDRIYLFEISFEEIKRAVNWVQGTGGLRYRPISAYPAVSRDLAPRVDERMLYAHIEWAIEEANEPLLEQVRLTDIFRGAPLPEGTKSLTLSFTFRAADHTLSEAEVTLALANIRTRLEAHCGATFAG